MSVRDLLLAAQAPATGVSGMLACEGSSPYLNVYPWSGSALGTKVTPASPPESISYSAAFSPDGAFIAVAYAGTKPC